MIGVSTEGGEGGEVRHDPVGWGSILSGCVRAHSSEARGGLVVCIQF